jgi:hypothetical protein
LIESDKFIQSKVIALQHATRRTMSEAVEHPLPVGSSDDAASDITSNSAGKNALTLAFQEVSDLSLALKAKALDIAQRESRVEELLLAAEDQRMDLEQRQAGIEQQMESLEQLAREMADQQAYIDATVEERCVEIKQEHAARVIQERARAKKKLQVAMAAEATKLKYLEESTADTVRAATQQTQRLREDFAKQRVETQFYKRKCQALTNDLTDSHAEVAALRKRLEQAEFERNHLRSKLKVAAWKAQQQQQTSAAAAQAQAIPRGKGSVSHKPQVVAGNENVSDNRGLRRTAATKFGLVLHEPEEDNGKLSASCLDLASMTQQSGGVAKESEAMPVSSVLDLLDDVLSTLTPCRTFTAISSECHTHSLTSFALIREATSLLPGIVNVLKCADWLLLLFPNPTGNTKPRQALRASSMSVTSRSKRSSATTHETDRHTGDELHRPQEEDLGRVGRFLGVAFLVADAACREAIQTQARSAEPAISTPEEWARHLGRSANGTVVRDLSNLVEVLSTGRVPQGE